MRPLIAFGLLAAVWSVPASADDAMDAVKVLIEDLKDPSVRTRMLAVSELLEMGPRAKAAVPALIAALKDEDPRVRLSAVQALGAVGPDAKTAAPALME